MKPFELVHLLLLLFLLNEASCLCSLDKTNAARCHDLEDVRYIETYHLHTLRAPSYSRLLSPGNFRNLTSLRHLDLSGGRIEDIESGSFAKLGSLQTLNLAENKLSHLEAGAFDGLKHLHSLKLGDNAIQQLPSALMSLKELRLLDISNNPLNCNCASLKLRDALLTRGVKISKKTICAEPPSAKDVSIFKPDTKMTCLFAKQDEEMQADQPSIPDGGSGESELLENEEDETLEEAEKDLDDAEEKDLEQPEVGENDAESLSPTQSETSSPEPNSSPEVPSSIEQTEQQSVTTIASRDDITFDDSEKEATTLAPTSPEQTTSELASSSEEPSSTVSSTTSATSDDSAVINESSGENDADFDEGSGILEGSGMIARMPAIDFRDGVTDPEDSEEKTSSTSTTSTSTTTQGSVFGLFDNIGSVFSNFPSFFNPADATTTTTTTTTTTAAPPEKSPEEEIKEDGFIPAIAQEPPKSPKLVEEVEDTPAVREQSSRALDAPKEVAVEETNDLSDPEMSTEPKKGMGSYIVLAALLTILVGLIVIAAYKGDFCRKKRKRNDVERGTELKDMHRSLLEQNSGATTAKAIQANGNTMENVPLMTTCSPPEEPKDKQRSYDVSPAVPLSNGNGCSAKPMALQPEAPEPVKPPRKAQEIEAPLNGLNPPMEPIDAPDHSSCSDDSETERPPLTPAAQRVKITMQENPDSVPKTPILITRLKTGDNLVNTP